MRVIGGQFRSRRIASLPGLETRPTPDRVRETLFNILQGEIKDSIFVDAYAGTGAVGIEAISRGARHSIFIEKSRAAINLIGENLASLKIQPRARVIHGAAPLFLMGLEADIVFLDPPYDKEREYRASFDSIEAMKKQPRVVVAQHSARFSVTDSIGALKRIRLLKHGENALSFYRADNQIPAPAEAGAEIDAADPDGADNA